MKNYSIPTAFAVLFLAAILFVAPGCNNSTTPADPAATQTRIEGAIETGSSAAVSIGLVAIPDPVEANNIATLAGAAIDNNVMPILNGDNAGLIAGLNQILTLSAFNDPKLAKAKLVLEAAMPIVLAYLPPDVAHATSIPDNVKGDLVAFFKGAREGITNYQATGTKDMKAERDFVDYADLRKKLSAK